MSKGNVYRQQVLAWALQGVTPAWAKQKRLYVALHSAEPVDSQSDSESSYDGYERVAIERTDASFKLADDLDAANAELRSEIRFAECKSGSVNISHWSIGTSDGVVLYSAKLETEVELKAPMQPYFSAGSLTISER